MRSARVIPFALATALACARSSEVGAEEFPRGPAVSRNGPSAPRRDPFAIPRRELPGQPAATPVRPDGLEGVTIDEMVVRGVLHARERSVAIVQGAGTICYVARAGDRLRDGRVLAIDAGGVVAVVDADHARGATRARVRKTVRAPRESR